MLMLMLRPIISSLSPLLTTCRSAIQSTAMTVGEHATPTPHEADDRSIVWFDIDNTLYPASARINDLMKERIHAYFLSMGLAEDEASKMHKRYYTEYGLALRGLVRHHKIDALDFDRKCDGSLPLDRVLKPDPAVRKLLEDIDRSKTRVWALTNAYSNHAYRVLKILKLDDLIERVAFCDYTKPDFSCKPEPQFYHDAMAYAKMKDPSKCFFVDDNLKNVQSAKTLGWGSCVYFQEDPSVPELVASGAQHPVALNTVEGVDATITSLLGLRKVWPQLFKAPSCQQKDEL
ncbi:hypothetical protein FRB93_007433 [Tulasnella sp. JGI-2019a]|nr:hypothetical protein FRB93_007433 [Tulasnella sp. JGI-2019a]